MNLLRDGKLYPANRLIRAVTMVQNGRIVESLSTVSDWALEIFAWAVHIWAVITHPRLVEQGHIGKGQIHPDHHGIWPISVTRPGIENRGCCERVLCVCLSFHWIQSTGVNYTTRTAQIAQSDDRSHRGLSTGVLCLYFGASGWFKEW